jgi:succinylglutamic semialdehyde dehydrogenase
MKTWKGHFINGEWIDGAGAPFFSIDPATGEQIWEGQAAGPTEVDHAVAAARKAYVPWSALTQERRFTYLERFAAVISSHARELAEIISQETGKPFWEARTETQAMVAKIEISWEAYRERCREVSNKQEGGRTVLRFRPHGVVAVLGPFNLPGHLPHGHIAPALLAGNTVVFKPSEQAPLVAEVMVRYWEEADLPRGVLNMVQGGRETGSALSVHSGLDGLYFTGSFSVGQAIHKACAGQPQKILALEMGGNNPLVVHEVSDTKAAAYATALSAFITSGQRCTCARRLIVPVGSSGDRFIDQLVGVIEGIRIGPYTDLPEPFMGPVISDGSATSLMNSQEDLLARGASPVLPMQRLPGKGAFLTPGLVDVTPITRRPDGELFGPLLQLVRVTDFEEALAEANNTDYGLAAGLLSDSLDHYHRFLGNVRAGVINWNRPLTGASSRLPFGGVKKSGNHRPSGYFAVDYCSYPVASIEHDALELPESPMPGIEIL